MLLQRNLRVCLFLLCLFDSFFFERSLIAENPSPFKVGAILPLSGPMAFVGDGTLKGLTLARDLINERGGIGSRPIELVVEDSKSDAASGVAAFRKLSAIDNVGVIYCALTSVSMAIKPIAEKLDVLVFVQSVHPGVLEGSSTFLRTFFTVAEADTRLTVWLQSHSLKRLGLVYAEEEWGEATKRDLLHRSKDNGIEVIASFSVKRDQNDLRSELLRFKAEKPDAIYIAAIGPVVGTVARQLSELGIQSPRIFISGCSQAAHQGSNKEFLDGFDIGPRLDPENAVAKELLGYFAKRFPSSKFVPDQHLLSSFDALGILKVALSASPNATPRELRQALIALPPRMSSQGLYDFDTAGEISAPMGIYQLHRGVCGPLDASPAKDQAPT